MTAIQAISARLGLGTRSLMWWLKVVATAGAMGLAGFLLWRTLGKYDPEQLVSSVLSVPTPSLLLAIGWAAASYLCLTGFDWLGLRYAGHPLPYRKAALTSFVSLSIGHNIGLAALSSGAVRYRYYSREGLSGTEVAKVVVFSGLTVAVGLIALGGVVGLVRPQEAERVLHVSEATVLAIALSCLAAVGLYVLAAWAWRRPIGYGRWSVELPHVRLAAAQVVLGAVNYACMAECLHQILSTSLDLTYLATASILVLASTAMLVAHVPGGLGVIEAVVVSLVPGAGVLPLVLVFRFVYFLLPLAIGGALLALTELRSLHRDRGRKRQRAAGETGRRGERAGRDRGEPCPARAEPAPAD